MLMNHKVEKQSKSKKKIKLTFEKIYIYHKSSHKNPGKTKMSIHFYILWKL